MSEKRFVRIVAASPSDVNSERKALQRVVNRINRELGVPLGIHIELSRWETDTFPAFHIGGSQEHVESVLRIEDCDILICIFGRRFGTRTKRARSGTESEFRRAYESWKQTSKPQIMMYFLALPPEALYWEYKNSREFSQLVRQHLAAYFAHSPRPLLYRVPLSSLSSRSSAHSSKRYTKSRGEYHIRANKPLRRPGSDLKMPLTDFDFEVVARKVSGSNTSWYGVYVVQGRGSNDVLYHDFFISGKGTYTYEVKRMDKNETSQKDLTIVQPSQLGMSIRPSNSANHLRLIRREGVIEFEVNGSRVLQATTSLSRTEEVQVGIAVHAERKLPANQHIEVAFSEWVFYKPE